MVNYLAMLLLLLPAICSADICKTSAPVDVKPYATEMGKRQVTFVVMDYKTNHCRTINEAGLTQRHSPYSTFKIPHTFIALETGAARSMQEYIEWNRQQYPAKNFWPETWKRSHTLASAFKHSAVWYYQALVPRIEPQEYKEWLATFQYGNQAFTAGSDEFWLNNELRISPAEQVEFITCLLKTGCGVKPANLAAFESAALQANQNGFSLYAKTGAGSIDPNNNDGAFEGWYVGYIKASDERPTAVFAIYMEAENFAAIKNYRKELSLQLLKDLGFFGR